MFATLLVVGLVKATAKSFEVATGGLVKMKYLLDGKKAIRKGKLHEVTETILVSDEEIDALAATPAWLAGRFRAMEAARGQPSPGAAE